MKEKKQIHVKYFAALREQAGRSEDNIETEAATPRDLYKELAERHQFRLLPNQIKVAINRDFADMDQPLQTNDIIVFVPPVAGG